MHVKFLGWEVILNAFFLYMYDHFTFAFFTEIPLEVCNNLFNNIHLWSLTPYVSPQVSVFLVYVCFLWAIDYLMVYKEIA